MGEGVYKIMLVMFLREIGRLLERAGEEPKNLCNLDPNKFCKYEILSCDFIKEYLGDEYAQLFIEKVLDVANRTSQGGKICNENEKFPLLSPDIPIEGNNWLSKYEGEKVWYSATYLDLNKKQPEDYSLKNKDDALCKSNYKEIVDKLKYLVGKLKGINDAKSILETFEYILRSLLLFVPASEPNVSLYGQGRFDVALSPFNNFKAILIDIKGIQRFISNIQKEADASKRFRGRSLFLQLLQQAIIDYIADQYSLSEINNLSFEPGKILFLIYENSDTSKIKERLHKLEEWLEYEIQFSIRESKLYSVQNLNFEDLLKELFEDYEIIGNTKIIEGNEVDRYGVVSNKIIKVDENNISMFSSLAPGTLNVGDSVSLISLITLIIGHASRNLRYIVEVILDKDEEQSYDAANGVGKISIAPLGITFYLIHEKKGVDVEKVLRYVVMANKDKAKRIKVFTVNETIDFIHEDLLNVFDKISFGYILLNTYHPTDESGNFMSLDSMGNYVGLGVIDGDRIGEKVKELSKYPDRFMTFSSIMNFVFTYIPVYLLNQKINSQRTNNVQEPKIVVLYAGGDDIAVYGKWDEVFELLSEMKEYIKDMLYQVTVSGGLFVFKPAYPIYYAYKNARELEDKAKEQRKHLQDGVVDSNIFENYYIGRNKIKALEWNEVKDFLEKARKLLKEDISNSFLYKLYSIGDIIEGKNESNKPTDEEILRKAKSLVTYAYLVARNDKEFEKLKRVYPIEEYKGVNADIIINQLLKLRTLINMYSLLRRT